MRKLRACALAVAFATAMGTVVAKAQDLTVGLSSSVTSIDPHFHNLSPNTNIALHIFNPLILKDEHQRLMPGLATEWKAIDDTTWEFKLRRGVKFHDGSEFTADDVVATLKRIPWVPNSPSSFRIYTQGITSWEVLDPYTIRFKTAAPYPLLPLDASSFMIVPKKDEQAPTGDFNSGKAAIGTGPFRFVEFVPGDRIVLERNDAYWGPKPAWQHVTLKIIPNNSARVAALLAGDVQIIEQVPSIEYAKLKSNPDLTISQIVGNRLIYLAMDSFRDQSPFVTDKEGAVLPNNPLKDARVRRALSKAINRQAIVDRIMDGVALPAGGLLPEGFFGVSPKLKPEPFDPEGAKKLLTEAGYPNGFGLTIHGPNDRYLNDEKVLQAIGPMFSRIGIDTKVDTKPWATYASQASAPTYAYSVMLFGWGADTGEVSSPLRSLIATPDKNAGMGGSNRGRYSNPKVDALLKTALETVDDAKRDKLLQQATEVAIADQGIIPLQYQINVWATRKGYSYAARADEYTLAQSVQPAK
ncbi:MAG TPA: ABC transporter substrate-binding protein [Alphaproteobacteria bacterium]|nr:ABC transporter substrate-binding protein [Alphaproteobacteria bacterium]